MVKLANELQFSKAPDPMWIAESGIAKVAEELQPEKGRFPILVTESGMLKLLRDLHCKKAPYPMLVTEFVMVKRCSLRNGIVKGALPKMWVSGAEMVTLTSVRRQPSNAFLTNVTFIARDFDRTQQVRVNDTTIASP